MNEHNTVEDIEVRMSLSNLQYKLGHSESTGNRLLSLNIGKDLMKAFDHIHTVGTPVCIPVGTPVVGTVCIPVGTPVGTPVCI